MADLQTSKRSWKQSVTRRRERGYWQHLADFFSLFLSPLGFRQTSLVLCSCVCECVCWCLAIRVCPLALQWVTLGIELHRSGSASATGESCQLSAPIQHWTDWRPTQKVCVHICKDCFWELHVSVKITPFTLSNLCWISHLPNMFLPRLLHFDSS